MHFYEKIGGIMDDIKTVLHQLKLIHEMGQIKGKYKDIPIEAYHDPECPGVSSSTLSAIHKGIPYFLSRVSKGKTDAMVMGSAIHDAILLPDLFAKKYVPEPEDKNLRSTAGKESYRIFLKVYEDRIKNEGLTILKRDKWEQIIKMREKVLSHPVIANALRMGEKEVTYFCQHEETGLLRKCRTDLVLEEQGIILDLKTTTDCSKNAFSKEIAKYGYDRTAAYYCDILRDLYGKDFLFGFIAIEKEEPYNVGLYLLGSKSMVTGKSLYLQDLLLYREFLSMEKTEVNERALSFESIEIPDWAHHLEAR